MKKKISLLGMLLFCALNFFAQNGYFNSALSIKTLNTESKGVYTDMGYHVDWRIAPLDNEQFTIYEQKSGSCPVVNKDLRAFRPIYFHIYSPSDYSFELEVKGRDVLAGTQIDFSSIVEKSKSFITRSPLTTEIGKLLTDLQNFDDAYDETSNDNNHWYFIDDYKRDILSLQKNIVDKFGFDEPTSSADLKVKLLEKFSAATTSEKTDINSISYHYGRVINKKQIYKITEYKKKVPDNDIAIFKIKKSGSDGQEFTHEIDVKGGFKVDFGTGIFFHGINDPAFSFKSIGFKYYSDSSGTIADTSGKVIVHDNKRPNLAIGTIVHFYGRICSVFGVGGSVGLMLDLNGNVTGMLGGSVHFRAGEKVRISLIGGLALGQKTQLSKTRTEFSGDEKSVYQRETLPTIYSADEDEIPTYKKFAPSWFAGVTFNFPSTQKSE